MKAFVIKNKEGKYFVNRYVQAKKIYNAFIFEDKNDAEQVKGEDDEVVEITIAEGDLEQEIEELKEQLAEKEKEIRKQVYSELRDFIQKNESPSFSQSLCGYWFISAKKLFEYLDQIEQGESKK